MTTTSAGFIDAIYGHAGQLSVILSMWQCWGLRPVNIANRTQQTAHGLAAIIRVIFGDRVQIMAIGRQHRGIVHRCDVNRHRGRIRIKCYPAISCAAVILHLEGEGRGGRTVDVL